jgi:hypothetical protein
MSFVITRDGVAKWRGKPCGRVYRKSSGELSHIVGWEFVPDNHNLADAFGRRQFGMRRLLANEITRAFVKMERVLKETA